MGFPVCVGAGPVGGGRRNSEIRLQQRGRSRFLRIPFDRREKYNAVTRSSETQVTAGYHMNIVGFGWTNGVFLSLLHQLPETSVTRLADEQTAKPGSGR